MMNSRIYRFICILAISFASLSVGAQEPHKPQPGDTLVNAPQASVAITLGQEKEKAPLIGGFAVSMDLVGVSMKALNSKYANMEASARLDIKEKYFPIFELGIGDCTKEGGDNENKFSVTAPYFRVGMDYNFNKKLNGNRFFGGARYAFSSYNFDFTDKGFCDPVWGTKLPLEINSANGKTQWLEIVIGVETKLWSIVRFGWNIRYKARLKQTGPAEGEPWYVPGFGKNSGSGFGGTVNLTFDVGKTAWNKKKKGYSPVPGITITDTTPANTQTSDPEKTTK